MWNVRLSFATAMYHFYTNVLIFLFVEGEIPKFLKEERGGRNTSETSNQDFTSSLFSGRTCVISHS